MRTSLLMAHLVSGIGSSRYALPRSSPVCVDLPYRLGQLTQQRSRCPARYPLTGTQRYQLVISIGVCGNDIGSLKRHRFAEKQ
jgi:hypothetical protein